MGEQLCQALRAAISPPLSVAHPLLQVALVCRGLLYCMEYLEENLDDWLGEELEPYGDDDYLIFDCPGQIELYSHVSVFRTFVDFLKHDGWNVCVVYCLDSQFASEVPKYIAGCLSALSAMVQLELPHVNVLTKMDICKNKVSARFVVVYTWYKAAKQAELGIDSTFSLAPGCRKRWSSSS